MDMNDEADKAVSEPFRDLEPIKDTRVAPAVGIAGLALSMAMKYHDMGMIKDGAMYQQYKLEGRNIRTIGLDDVFETAIKIEMHLLGADARIAKLVVDALTIEVEDDDEAKGEDDKPAVPIDAP